MVAMHDIQQHRDEIRRLAEQHGAHDLRVFGSVARGENQPGSDLDLLVRMDDERSLLDRIALQQDLSDLLGVDVDVVNEKAINTTARKHILRDGIKL